MVFVRFEFCPLFRLTDLSNYQSEMNQSERTGNDLLGQGGCQKTFLRHVRLFTRKLLCYELQRNISTQNWKETTKRQIGWRILQNLQVFVEDKIRLSGVFCERFQTLYQRGILKCSFWIFLGKENDQPCQSGAQLSDSNLLAHLNIDDLPDNTASVKVLVLSSNGDVMIRTPEDKATICLIKNRALKRGKAAANAFIVHKAMRAYCTS